MLGDALKIGLKEEEFWKMTPKRLRMAMEAYLWQKDQQGVMLSTFTAAVINTQIKKRIKPSDLYRPVLINQSNKKHIPKTKEDWAKRKEEFEKSVSLMGPEAIPVVPRRLRGAGQSK
jgi:inner membrane protein involved in colicin E2 resistance